MPIINSTGYSSRPWFLFNKHLETVVPSMFFKITDINYRRERLELEDGDFLDLDWLGEVEDKLIIITHGLEGNSERHYVQRPAKLFVENGWCALAWNCRSCSGEMNRLPRFYHHGDTNDLSTVVDHAVAKGFKTIVLMGLSMGGSMSLKYLGEPRKRPAEVKGAVTFSVPCNLKDSAVQLKVKGNGLYEKRFLNKLKKKILLKAEKHEGVDSTGLDTMTNFDEFHKRYTVPLHGFKSLEDFFQQATCDQYLPEVKYPVLIGNAVNDPLLGVDCYPLAIAEQSKYIHLEMPKVGGHVGFTIKGDQYSWMDYRALEFVDSELI